MGRTQRHREGGLRLDKKESAFGEADSGERAIVPGKADESELFRRLTTDDEYERMPPAETNKPLSQDEIELFRDWIQQGADWQSHWAFEAPVGHRRRLSRTADWPRGDLDRFVLARLEQEQLAPSPEADRVTLLRRVTFDLTGLPPTLEEIDAFLADESPSAYENVVDRLLRSPVTASTWRGIGSMRPAMVTPTGCIWTTTVKSGPIAIGWFEPLMTTDRSINSSSNNWPVTCCPTQRSDQQIATGFIRCHVTTSEGGSIEEEVYVRNVNDRVVTLGTVFMGATFECTRCHDHKFDPLHDEGLLFTVCLLQQPRWQTARWQQKGPRTGRPCCTDEQQQQLDDFDEQIASLQAH